MAVLFDGVNDIIACGTSDNIMLNTSTMSISAWIFPFSTGEGGFGRILDKSSGGLVQFRLSGTNALSFAATGTTNLVTASAPNSITLRTWQHVCCTWDGSTIASNVHLYVNGVEVNYATTQNLVTAAINSSGVVCIGNRLTSANTFDGEIDEVSVWKSVLSLDEIKQLAFSKTRGIPNQINLSTLQAYWRLDDFSNNTSMSGSDSVRDISSNENHGTPGGGPISRASTLTYP